MAEFAHNQIDVDKLNEFLAENEDSECEDSYEPAFELLKTANEKLRELEDRVEEQDCLDVSDLADTLLDLAEELGLAKIQESCNKIADWAELMVEDEYGPCDFSLDGNECMQGIRSEVQVLRKNLASCHSALEEFHDRVGLGPP